MIMNIKQRKIKIEPKTKLNYNIYIISQKQCKTSEWVVRGHIHVGVNGLTNMINAFLFLALITDIIRQFNGLLANGLLGVIYM